MTAPALRVPAREIPVPMSISAEAQAVLSTDRSAFALTDPPALDDHEGWRGFAQMCDAAFLQMLAATAADDDGVTVEVIEVGGVPVYVATPAGVDDDDGRLLVNVHGGGFIMMGGECLRYEGRKLAARSGVRTWSIDYRMPPDHPYPVPLEDCLTVYREILRTRSAEDVIVSGGSAGGNIAAALVLRARDEGLPMPAAAVLMTPAIDLTNSGDSYQCNMGLDNVLMEPVPPFNLLYAPGHDPRDPYASPLFADYTKGFPSTLITSGTRDLFLSNAVLLHRKLRSAGVAAELHLLEAGGHGGFMGQAPEDQEIQAEIDAFIARHWR